ncbi:MAG: rhombosortase [Woeseiaceae bacterium]|nr:rhombosortase [Woeseiaceae bacterium]
MGLDKGLRRPFAGPRQSPGSWLLPVTFGTTALAAGIAGEPARTLFRYGRGAIADGEAWRLLTGHFVHLGGRHLGMNLLALLLIWVLVGRNLRIAQWLAVTAVVIAGIDAGFWWLEPQLEWYVGLSGVLHGLLVAGMLAGWPAARVETLLLGLALVLKLAYEQAVGPLPGSETTAGGAVVVNAHLYGAIAGAVAALLLLLRGRVGRTASMYAAQLDSGKHHRHGRNRERMKVTLAMIFPGQGSQSAGMQKALAAKFREVEQTYAEASDVLGYDLWKLVQEGPSGELDRTVVTQPAMLAAGIATARCWSKAGGPEPAWVAGHSLGSIPRWSGPVRCRLPTRLISSGCVRN